MSSRKRWAVVWSEIPGATRHRHTSKAAVYRMVNAMVGNWQAGGLLSPLLDVYVDEGDGHGWRLYERIDLRTWSSGE